MRTAIYARKSTSQDVADEAKSVSRQVEGARAFAEKRGWAVVGEHIYLDDGVSGAEWLDRDLNRLITAARAKPKPFDVLVTLDIDRVGRDGVHTVPKLAEVLDQGVRVFFYQTGEEVSVKTPMDVFMLQARAFAAADYRHQVRTKTRDALRAKAEKGYVAGGKVLGYRNVTVEAGGKKSHVIREVDPDQAEIVRRIFEMTAEGKGLLKIARALNSEGILNPTGQDRIDRGGKQKPKGKWATTGIRDVLRRELYIGKATYGRRAGRTVAGRKSRSTSRRASG